MTNPTTSGESSPSERDRQEQFNRWLRRYWIAAVLVMATVLSACCICAGLLDTIGALIIAGVLLAIVRIWIASFDPKVNKEEIAILYYPASKDLSPRLQKLEAFANSKRKFPFAAYLAVISAIRFNPET